MGYKLKRITIRPNGTEQQIRPKWEWQPWVNTVAYYIFDWNLNDSSGNSHNLSVASWSVTYGTASWWWKYVYLNRNTRTNYWSRSFDYSWENTISMWVNLQSTTGRMLLEMWSSWSEFLRVENAINYNFWWGLYYALTASTWYLLTYTRNGNTASLYVNWVLEWTGTPSYTWTHTVRFKLNSPWDTGSSSYTNDAYVSELIWEDKERTATDILKYYNSTKWNYWL